MANIPLTSKQMSIEAVELFRDAMGEHPRWLVNLNDPIRVVKASLNAAPLLEYSAGGRAYFVRAKDELDAYMKARKMEADAAYIDNFNAKLETLQKEPKL